MVKVYVVVTEEYFGGAETGNLKVFATHQEAQAYAETLSSEFERLIYETELLEAVWGTTMSSSPLRRRLQDTRENLRNRAAEETEA